MTAMQATMNAKVMARLSPTGTSEEPKKLQRNPLIRYTTGLNSATVRHPGVVAVLDSGEADGLRFVAFDYVVGETLAAVFERRPRSGRVVELVLDVADLP